jgi:hypothetical protein
MFIFLGFPTGNLYEIVVIVLVVHYISVKTCSMGTYPMLGFSYFH